MKHAPLKGLILSNYELDFVDHLFVNCVEDLIKIDFMLEVFDFLFNVLLEEEFVLDMENIGFEEDHRV